MLGRFAIAARQHHNLHEIEDRRAPASGSPEPSVVPTQARPDPQVGHAST